MTNIFYNIQLEVVTKPAARDYVAHKLYHQTAVKAGEPLHYISMGPLGYFRFAYLHEQTANYICTKLGEELARQSLADKVANIAANFVVSPSECLASSLIIDQRQ